jgi:ankyrin repeat protein
MDTADFQRAASLLRHGKFVDLDELLNQPDWKLSIDHKDDQGNTLLHIAAQNGSKRMAKLCLRYGADIDTINNNGQTALHFAFGYGYDALGEYLVQKGANDSLRNRFGFTPYEGLREDSVKNL